MRRLIILALCALPQAAAAGELSRSAGGLEYRFVGCAAPAEPDLAVDPKLTGPKARAAANARVKAYNVYIDGVNEYVECLAAEAKRDLESYYGAVTDSLDAEQERIAERADALRPGRGGAPRK